MFRSVLSCSFAVDAGEEYLNANRSRLLRMERWLRTGTCSEKTVKRVDELSSDESEGSECEPDPERPSDVAEPQRKRKRPVKLRKYDSSYMKWGFVESQIKGKPGALCVLCDKTLENSSMNPAKLKRHLEVLHPSQKNRSLSFFELEAESRSASQSKLPYEKPTKSDEVSLRLSYLIGRCGEAHTIGEKLVKPALITAAECLFNDKQVDAVKKIPLSNSTVGRRIRDLSSWIEDEVCAEMRSSEQWALQLDESTDCSGQAILMVFVRYVHDSEISEELLLSKSLETSTTGRAIFQLVDSYLSDHEINWSKCINVCTDGAGSMTGRYKGFVTRVKEVAENVTSTHCVIHREALAAKRIPASLKKVLDEAVKIVNFIKTRPLQSRIFAALCEEMGSAHTSLLLHSEVRWLSRGRVLNRIFELREEILHFSMDQDFYLFFKFKDPEWMKQLAYLADIFEKLNTLNTSLQGKELDVFTATERMNIMKGKLELWASLVREDRVDFFPTLQDYLDEKDFDFDSNLRENISEHLLQLKTNLELYFPAEQLEVQTSETWIKNPFQTSIIRNLSGRQNEQLVELRISSAMKEKFQTVSLADFWAFASRDFAELSAVALRVLIPFVTTYLCESGFSMYASTKTKYRNRLDAEADMRLRLSHKTPPFSVIAREKPCQSSH